MNSNCRVTSNKLQQDLSTFHLVVRRLPNNMGESRSRILRSKDSPGYSYHRRDFSFALATPFFAKLLRKVVEIDFAIHVIFLTNVQPKGHSAKLRKVFLRKKSYLSLIRLMIPL